MHICKSPQETVYCLTLDILTRYVAASVVTDTQTDRQTDRHRTTTVTLQRMRQGLNMHALAIIMYMTYHDACNWLAMASHFWLAKDG